jgi:hypothetical protein
MNNEKLFGSISSLHLKILTQIKESKLLKIFENSTIKHHIFAIFVGVLRCVYDE